MCMVARAPSPKCLSLSLSWWFLQGEEEGTWVKTWKDFEWARQLGYTLKKPTVSVDSSNAGIHLGTSLYSAKGNGVFCLSQKALACLGLH